MRMRLSGLFACVSGVAITWLMPHIALAAGSGSACSLALTQLEDIATGPMCFLSKIIIPLLILLEIVIFIYGVIRYFMNSGSEAERTKGNKFMVWGIFAIFVTFAVWGLVAFLQNSLQIGAGGTIRPPQLSTDAPQF